MSLWDVLERETLQTWLDEFLDVDCSNEVFEVHQGLDNTLASKLKPCYMSTNTQVHEDFAHGISEQLLRSRAADQVCLSMD